MKTIIIIIIVRSDLPDLGPRVAAARAAAGQSGQEHHLVFPGHPGLRWLPLPAGLHPGLALHRDDRHGRGLQPPRLRPLAHRRPSDP